MLAYVYLLISQFTPVNPGTQIQAYALAPSKHRAPFRHGLEEHSRVAVKGKDNCKYILHFAIQHYTGENVYVTQKRAISKCTIFNVSNSFPPNYTCLKCTTSLFPLPLLSFGAYDCSPCIPFSLLHNIYLSPFIPLSFLFFFISLISQSFSLSLSSYLH